MDFILNHLVIIIAGMALIFILPIIFRFFIKTVLLMVALGLIGSIFFGPDFLNNLQHPIAASQEFAQSTIQPFIKKELQNAKFDYNPKTKQYVIQNHLFTLEGIVDQDKANLVFNGKKYSIDVSFLKTFIEQQIGQQADQPSVI